MYRAPGWLSLDSTVRATRAEDIVNHYYAAIYNLAYRTLGHQEDAEDVAQETFVRALRHLGDLRDPASAGGWLYRIAANVCTDKLRQRQQQSRLRVNAEDAAWEDIPDTDPLGAPEPTAERRELLLGVWRAMMCLPPQQRLALALRKLHDMSYAEIAEAMQTSVSAVETLLFRARQGFRRAYEGEQGAAWGADCEWVLERLSVSIDYELAPDEQARVDAHVAVCTQCQFAARELRATSRLYGLIPLVSPPPDAQAAVLGALSAAEVGTSGGLLAGIGAAKMGLAATTAVMVTAATLWTVTQLGPVTPAAMLAPPPPVQTQSHLTDDKRIDSNATAAPVAGPGATTTLSPTAAVTATVSLNTPQPIPLVQVVQPTSTAQVTALPGTVQNDSSVVQQKASPAGTPSMPLTTPLAAVATLTPTLTPMSSALPTPVPRTSVPTNSAALSTVTPSPTVSPEAATQVPTLVPTATALPLSVPPSATPLPTASPAAPSPTSPARAFRE